MDQQPGDNNKTYTYIVGGLVVLALIAWAIYAYNHKSNITSTNDDQNSQNQNQQISPVDNATTTPTSTPTSSVTPPKKLSYGDAIKAYPYRFQFSQCHGNPGTMAVKKSSIVMLDNRDAVAHTIKADKQSFKIAAYDYVLLDASILTSNTVNVTCDGGGAAILNVEK